MAFDKVNGMVLKVFGNVKDCKIKVNFLFFQNT